MDSAESSIIKKNSSLITSFKGNKCFVIVIYLI